jgi:hypothetical protein
MRNQGRQTRPRTSAYRPGFAESRPRLDLSNVYAGYWGAGRLPPSAVRLIVKAVPALS